MDIIRSKKLHYLISMEIIKKCTKFGFEVEIYNNSSSNFETKVRKIGVDAYDKLHFKVNNYGNLPNIILFSTDNIYKLHLFY